MSVELDAVIQQTRRDRWGRYMVVPPDGTKPVGYVRATTVADTISDKEALFPWSQVMSMTGLMRRPGLRGRFEALMSAHPTAGPWYGGDDAKKEAKRIAAECKEAGGATDRADLGTSRHTIIEQVHRGQAPLITQADTQRDVDAYTSTIAAAGLVVDPKLCETIVVLDRYQIAGTADMLRVTVPGEGDFVGDLKTGATLDYSTGAIAQQLAIYANADNIYRQGAAADGSDDQRHAMPEVSKERAIVVHLPAGEARCVVYWVDIAAGMEALERSLWVRDWRKRRDLFVPFNLPKPPDRETLRVRYLALPAVDQERYQQFNIPKDDLAAIAAALDELETLPTMLEQARERMAADAERTTKPAAEADDEGGDVDIDDELRVLAAFLTDEARAWVGAITSGPITQGKPIRYTHRKVRRRADIAVALAKWAALGYHDDAFRAALHAVTDDPTTFWPTLTLQDILATFDATQAAWLKNFVDAIGGDKYALIACDDGTYRWKHR